MNKIKIKIKEIVLDKNGSVFEYSGIVVLAVVLVAILIMVLVPFFRDTLIPKVQETIMSWFDYIG